MTTESSDDIDSKDRPVLENSASSSFLMEQESSNNNADAALLPQSECEALLEQTVDNCVACVDNVDAQHEYEEKLHKVDSHGLTAAEASQIRLSAMEAEVSGVFPEIDLQELNICGTDDLEDVKTFQKHSSHSTTTTKMDNMTTKQRPSSPPTLHCAVCFDDVDSFQNTSVTFCELPCCGSDGREARSTTKVCTACMLLLSSPTTSDNKRIGRCPRCRSWLVISNGALDIQAVQSAGKCKVCNQIKENLVENEDTCDACFLGRTRPLFYECKECHYPQRIPHPMYRYQSILEDFGTTSWACQGPCQNFTNWRILPDQVAYIPVGDVPEEWGNDYLETARERVMEARRNMAALNNNNAGDGGCTVQ